eukprot:5544088-Amphidinium_carterae.1
MESLGLQLQGPAKQFSCSQDQPTRVKLKLAENSSNQHHHVHRLARSVPASPTTTDIQRVQEQQFRTAPEKVKSLSLCRQPCWYLIESCRSKFISTTLGAARLAELAAVSEEDHPQHMSTKIERRKARTALSPPSERRPSPLSSSQLRSTRVVLAKLEGEDMLKQAELTIKDLASLVSTMLH